MLIKCEGAKCNTLNSGLHKIYFGAGTLTIKLISHVIMDQMLQQTTKRTKNPARIVRRGGPWAALLVSFTSDPSVGDFSPTELGFVAKTVTSLWFTINLLKPLHLDTTKSRRYTAWSHITTNKIKYLWLKKDASNNYVQYTHYHSFE